MESMSSPETGPVDDLPLVAPQLRALRRRAALTLEAAARSAGLSPAAPDGAETSRIAP